MSSPSEFDAHAANYDAELQQGLALAGENKEYFAEGRVRWVHERLAQLNFQPAAILDFGCGTGSASPFFLSCYPRCQLTGVDVSAESLEVARRQFGPQRSGGSAERRSSGTPRAAPRPRFLTPDDLQPEGQFDLAFCNGVFHHIPLADRPASLNYVFRALRPGGLFALWENNPWNPGTRFVMSRIPFDRDAITLSPPEAVRLVRSGGFQVLRRDSRFYLPRALSWFRFFERALVRLPFGGQYLVLCQKP